MMATTHSPMLKVREAAAVFRLADLRAFAYFDHMVGHHVRVEATGALGGYYIVTPAQELQFKVRWVPDVGPVVTVGLSATPAHAAGLVLDHQDGLLP